MELLLGYRQPVGGNSLDRVCGIRDEVGQECSLGRGKVLEHKVGGVLPTGVPIEAMMERRPL